MALSCLGSGGDRERLDLVDSAALDLPATGWTVFAMFYPDSTLGINTFSYIYAHGDPGASAPALNIFCDFNQKVRVIVNSIFGVEADFVSTNLFVANAWNAVGVRYDPTPREVSTHLNGVETVQATAFALNTLTPTGNARIGDATHGPDREFNGRICHPSKWDRNFAAADLDRFTSELISPEFIQQDHVWHVPLWNASFNFDQLGAITTVPEGAMYGNHAPASYPSDPWAILPVPKETPPTSQIHSVQWSLA